MLSRAYLRTIFKVHVVRTKSFVLTNSMEEEQENRYFMPRMEILGILTVGWLEVLAVACMVAAGRTSSDNLCYTRLIYTVISLSYP